MKKNKNLIILIGIVIIIAFGIGGYFYIDYKKNNNLEYLLKINKYDRAYDIIKNQNLLSDKNKDKTYKTINNKIKEYKITSVDDYFKLSNNDINNIKSYNEMINRLQLYEDFTYLSKLSLIDDKFHDNIPVIKWFNSDDYKTYKKNMEVNDLEDYENSGESMKDYSLKIYGLDNNDIKRLDTAIKSYVVYCEKFTEFLKTKDMNFYNTFGNEFQENLYELNYLETYIKNKNTDLENAIKELPEI